MKIWQDINEAIPAAPGIYWTKSDYGSSKPMLTYYFGYHQGWAHVNSIDDSQSHIEVSNIATPDLWMPVNPPEN